MRKVPTYLAAPLFNSREQEFNLDLARRLEFYCDVFLPQRDGALLVDLVGAGIEASEAERRIFHRDVAAIQGAHLLVAVLDGAHIDEGVAFEIGYASAFGVPCIGLQTDVRRALPTGNNPMITQALQSIYGTVSDLVDAVRLMAESPNPALPQFDGT